MDDSLDQGPFSLNIPDYKEPAAEERRTEEAAVEQGSNLINIDCITEYLQILLQLWVVVIKPCRFQF